MAERGTGERERKGNNETMGGEKGRKEEGHGRKMKRRER